MRQRMSELELMSESEGCTSSDVLQLKFSPQFQFLADGEGASSRLAGAKRISNIRFSNVNYTLNGEKRLVQVSGETQPGEMLTILGPIKAGKTKLLNVLAGTVRSAHNQSLNGEFQANDDEHMFSLLRAGFVARNDAMFSTSTVEEQLNFNANMRLPAKVTADQRKALIKDITDSLGLSPFSHMKISSLPIGIRKRVAIGSELATCPNALFLDEPTTNMESDVAWEIMRILNRLAASRACVVITSIQNPPSMVFGELSHIILLGKGHVLYRGHTSGLQAAFASKSLIIPLNSNPADFVLMTARLLSLDLLPRADAGKLTIITDDSKGEPVEKELFQHRPRHRSAFYEFGQLLIRELRATWRDPRLFIGRVLSQAIIMIVAACVFLNGGDQSNPSYFLATHFASFVFTMFSTSFGTTVPTVMFLYESKPVFVRERAVNSFGTPPAVLARLIPQLVVNFIVAIITVLILYWAVEWNGSFILIVVAYYLLMLSCVSWAYLLAFTVNNVAIAVGLVALVLVPQLLFLGSFVRVNYLPIWLQWVSYVCNITYALRLIQNWELSQENCRPQFCPQWRGLTNSNIAYQEHTWWFILILVLYIFVLRVVAFIFLRRKIMNTTRFGEL